MGLLRNVLSYFRRFSFYINYCTLYFKSTTLHTLLLLVEHFIRLIGEVEQLTMYVALSLSNKFHWIMTKFYQILF